MTTAEQPPPVQTTAAPHAFELRVGAIGHRCLNNPVACETAIRRLLNRIEKALTENSAVPLRWTVVSPLAKGADRIIARVAMENVAAHLEVIAPFSLAQYRQDFDSPHDTQEFEDLLGACRSLIVLDSPTPSDSATPETAFHLDAQERNQAYLHVGQAVLDASELLIVIWDGQPSSGVGGTANVIPYALAKRRIVIRLDPNDPDAEPVLIQPVAQNPQAFRFVPLHWTAAELSPEFVELTAWHEKSDLHESIHPLEPATLVPPGATTESSPGVLKKLTKRGPRKLLAIDGGGVRGGIALGILQEIQDNLRRQLNNDQLVLADYFDYVAGTSVGAIFASCIALGMSVEQMSEFTRAGVDHFFQPAGYKNRAWYKYTGQGLKARLLELFGHETLGSPRLQTLLMLMMRNASTDSAWPVSNNPRAKFNDPNLADCNLHLPLWQIVRASAAAQTFFPPEEIQIGPKRFSFVDGGSTTANNPALQLYLQATLPAYRLGWKCGVENLLLVSVGTGQIPVRNVSAKWMLPVALNLIQCLLATSSVENDLLCRVLGKCVVGDPIDSELGDLIDQEVSSPKHFTYCRYDVELSERGFADLSCPVHPHHCHTTDDVRMFDAMFTVGQAVGKAKVQQGHFRNFDL